MTKDQAPAHILIVDDHPENLNVLSDALEAVDYRVLGATSGETSLKIAAKKKPDLILLDIAMPGMDGFETCRRLKADPQTCNIPVLFLSALDEGRIAEKGFDAGAEDYIAKPFVVAEVLARVRTHLALARATAQLERRGHDKDGTKGD